ncbi:MAG: WYL domain-containing protein, partial [Comamonas sp.]|nr:WYL domain-containing protein [Comamonas sp.]
TKPRHAHPYRLIHKNGVWYLAAEEAGRLKNFSVALIEQLQVDSSTPFAPPRPPRGDMAAQDAVWVAGPAPAVLLRIAPDIAHYFARRQLLPQQQHRQDSDGSLLVTTQINHINQLLPVVRYWLPHVRIVQPKAWEEELVRGLEQALVMWEP